MSFDEDDIRREAYRLSEKEGHPEGRERDFWRRGMENLKDRDERRERRREIWSAGPAILAIGAFVTTFLTLFGQAFGQAICDSYAAQFGIDATHLAVSSTSDFLWLCAKGMRSLLIWFLLSGGIPLVASLAFSGRYSRFGGSRDDLKAPVAVLFLAQGIIVSLSTLWVLHGSIGGEIFAGLVGGSTLLGGGFLARGSRKALHHTSLTVKDQKERIVNDVMLFIFLSFFQSIFWVVPSLLWGAATNGQTRDAAAGMVIISALSGFAILLADKMPGKPALWRAVSVVVTMAVLCLIPHIRLLVVNGIFKKSGLGRIPGVEFSINKEEAYILKGKGFAVEKLAKDAPEDIRRILDAYLVAKGRDVYYLLPRQPATASTILESIPDSITEVPRQDVSLVAVSNPLANFQAQFYDFILALPEAEDEPARFEWALSQSDIDISDQRWAHIWPSRKLVALSVGYPDKKADQPWRAAFNARPDVKKALAGMHDSANSDAQNQKLAKQFYAHYFGIDIDKLLKAAEEADADKAFATHTFDFASVRPDGASPGASYSPFYISFLSPSLKRLSGPPE